MLMESLTSSYSVGLGHTVSNADEGGKYTLRERTAKGRGEAQLGLGRKGERKKSCGFGFPQKLSWVQELVHRQSIWGSTPRIGGRVKEGGRAIPRVPVLPS